MQERPRYFRVVSTVLGILLGGCASYSADPNPDFIFDKSAVRIEEDGVIVGAVPWFDPENMKAGFGLDLSKGGYYPVHLRIANLGDARIFIERDQITLTDSSGAEYASIASEDVARDLRRNSVAYGLLGFGILSFQSAERANAQMRRDWAAKELPPSTLLGRGDARTGFVFFQLPEGISPISTTIRIRVQALTGARETVLSASFSK